MRFAEKNDRLLHGLAQIMVHHVRLRHAGESGKFIDHAFDMASLTLNRLGELVKGFAVFGNDLAVLAADAFGGQLDWRQRVLDFMGDALGDIGPCTGSLSGNQFGDVVECQNRANVPLACPFERDAHCERAFHSVDGQCDLFLLALFEAGFTCLRISGREFGNGFAQRLADEILFGGVEKDGRTARDKRNAVVAIQADHAGRYA